ncbi:LacI family DNA-binding transcriptional regulator [Mycolicibacterium neoaurum]|uniref:LacI family DNA-binding transcriptional regulator n=1 Tax=Mycolicibacterium neoaurum TaxID=1795 RepID=UPI00248A9C25|nr:LacI family DNA-binding transcriptional regulator [Mycolicibacterium neoaurum]WBP95363.1 LacI family DNA-binding transcriptional regulator [Mycolicibacterium neoaurum]WBS08339.1 LacI family DNA-binding transcriptional regulator [Mycolicibacterium neoaurum]
MARARVTIRDVAEAAGVSATTVSHALNGKGEVSPATIERVRAAARRLGYRPSPTARALRQGRNGALVLILPREDGREVARQIVALDYYMAIAATAASVAFEHQRALILPPELTTAEDWESINPDGVLLCDPIASDPQIELLESIGIPVVSIERDAGRPDRVHYVAGDNTANTRLVLAHLREQGARRIALLTTAWTRAWSIDIDDAYSAWCAETGFPDLRVRVPVQFDNRAAYQAACHLLDGPEPPDAIYAPAEGYTNGALTACRERGLRIPQDVLVVGGIDGREARESEPAVTALDLHPDRQAAAAVHLLIDRIDGRDAQGPIQVPSTLQVRASSTRRSVTQLPETPDTNESG